MAKGSDKPRCKYGSKCYRKSKQHLEEYMHPHDKDTSSEPQKKKAKIDEFFVQENTSGTQDASNDTKDDVESTSAGQCSGYFREAETSSAEVIKSIEDPPSPEDIRENIRTKFLMQMPDDFYNFWEFAKTINKKSPSDAFKSSLGLTLVGPYDVLAGKHKKAKDPCYLRHWRYYYDPPEFMTVISGDDKKQFHFGYYRDDPREMPVFVASNIAKENCMISPRGENIFAAVLWYLEDKMKKEKIKDGQLTQLKEKIIEAAKTYNCSLEMKTKAMKERDKKVVCKTFHGAGIVVPVDENDVGYRPVPETPADLKKMFKKIADAKSEEECKKAMDPLMEIIMLIQFANDECDFGEGLELGLDLFSYGGDVFHKIILKLLPLAYQLLGRVEYAKIITEHLKERKHSSDLSVL